MSRRALRALNVREVDEPAVNLTPLIDVVFVILIMFIVVAPLLDLDRVELADSSGNAKEEVVSVQENAPITIHVRRDNQVLLNSKPVNLELLVDFLRRAKEQHPNARPQVFHDKKAHFGTYQAVKNAAEAAGFEEMDIVLKPR